MYVLTHPCGSHHTQQGKTGRHDPVDQNFSPVSGNHPSYQVKLKRGKLPSLSPCLLSKEKIITYGLIHHLIPTLLSLERP